MKSKPKRSSTRSKVHPYLSLSRWMTDLAFWRNPSPTPSWGYKVEEYESRLADQIKNERGIVALQQNVGKNHSIR